MQVLTLLKEAVDNPQLGVVLSSIAGEPPLSGITIRIRLGSTSDQSAVTDFVEVARALQVAWG
jgi:hypothetical protein